MKIYIMALIFFVSWVLHAQNPFSTALQFDGVDDYVEVANHSSLNPTTALTVEVRVWSNDYDRGQWQEFVMKGGNPPRQYFIRSQKNTGLAQFAIHDSFDQLHSVRSGEPLVNGTCYHVAGTYDGTFLKLYVNGVLSDVDSIGTVSIQQSSDPLTFGRLGGIDAEYYNGEVDEVRIWNIARTQSQIQVAMNDTLGPEYYASTDSGLVGYWRLDEGSGTTAFDLTSNNNHGTIKNGASYVPACDLVVAVEPLEPSALPRTTVLEQNYPNPFNPITTIRYGLHKPSRVSIKIYDILGREVVTMMNGFQSAGYHSVVWDGRNNNGQPVASGIYIYRMQAGHFVKSYKMLLTR